MLYRAIARLPQRINQLRTRERLTAQDLADICGVTERAVHLWESGQRKPSLTSAAKLAYLFDMTIDELLLGGN